MRITQENVKCLLIHQGTGNGLSVSEPSRNHTKEHIDRLNNAVNLIVIQPDC